MKDADRARRLAAVAVSALERSRSRIDDLTDRRHVTVVHTENRSARADAAASVAGSLPIVCKANGVWLMHEVNGSWQRHTPFRLGR